MTGRHSTVARARAAHENRYWGSRSLPKLKTEFFDAVTTPAAAGDGSIATIRMYGPIDSWGGFWGISTRDVGQVLDALPDSVTQIILRINSPGGEVFEGVSILNMLRAHKASVTAVVDGLAASAASIIAAGADETVMSPGTQMMIHSPSTIVWGNAVDLRQQADVLDGIEASIIEIYTAKAGEKDWASMLAADTWMTASAAVENGLADRIAVIPDAGESQTVGEDDEDDDELFLIPDDDIDDRAAAVVLRIAHGVAVTDDSRARLDALRNKRPAEPDDTTNQNKEVEQMPDIKKVTDRLGLSAEATEDEIVTAIDALEQPRAGSLPDGMRAVDSVQFDALVADAAAGREAREQQNRDRRSNVVDSAIRDGKIPAGRRDHYAALLERDEDGTTQWLDGLPSNTIPVQPKGNGGGVDDATDEDKLYNAFFPKKADEKQEA